MSTSSKKARNAIPESARAGSHLGPARYPVKFMRQVKDRDTGEVATKQDIHGYIDPALRVFQGGGERQEIINANIKDRPPLLSMMEAVWKSILESGEVDSWEMRDHLANVVYVIPIERAKRVIVRYKTALGWRIGVPVEYCDLINNKGEVMRTGKAYQPPLLVFGETAPELYVTRPTPPDPERRNKKSLKKSPSEVWGVGLSLKGDDQ